MSGAVEEKRIIPRKPAAALRHAPRYRRSMAGARRLMERAAIAADARVDSVFEP